MPRALKIAVLGLLLFVLAVAGVGFFYPPVRLFALAVTGRSPVCPVSNAVRSHDNLQRQIENNRRIIKASKLLEKDPAGYELWDTPDGRFWIPAGSRYVLPYNLAERERNIYGAGEQAVHPGDVVLDCGAHNGTDTRKWVEDGAKLVVAIEPAPENLECLRRNLKNEIAGGRVIVVEKGVWDRDDVLTLQVDPRNSAADSFIIHREGDRNGKQVPLAPIDKLVGELKLERVDFIKMDIEGAEQRALAGAQATLAKYHPRLSLASYHEPSDPERIPQLVRQAWPGYQMYCGPCSEEHGRVRPDVLYFR